VRSRAVEARCRPANDLYSTVHYPLPLRRRHRDTLTYSASTVEIVLARAAHPSLVSTNLTVILAPPPFGPFHSPRTYIHLPSIKLMYLHPGTLARLPTPTSESHSFSRTRRPRFFQHPHLLHLRPPVSFPPASSTVTFNHNVLFTCHDQTGTVLYQHPIEPENLPQGCPSARQLRSDTFCRTDSSRRLQIASENFR
jgi:hypothetical protein